MKSQMKIQNVLSDNGEKTTLVIKVAKNFAELCLCPGVLWRAELVNDEMGWLV